MTSGTPSFPLITAVPPRGVGAVIALSAVRPAAVASWQPAISLVCRDRSLIIRHVCCARFLLSPAIFAH